MSWLADYWWVILIILVGMVIKGMKELSRLDHKYFLKNKPELPLHRDNNAAWDKEDDWPKKKPGNIVPR
ncbi:MAG: YpfN family protein [Candidatus Malihini olakiniferum]